MKYTTTPLVGITVGLTIFALAGCSSSTEPETATAPAEAPWTVLFDGTSLKGWTPVGNANWELADGAVGANMGNGYLVSDATYTDFELSVEFWVDEPANSGVFLRCQDTSAISADNAYEVNIFDTRPDQTYRTASIVNVSAPRAFIDTAGKWNTFEIKAQGPRLTVMANGQQTVDVTDTMHTAGPIALQYGAGVVKFRSVKIRTL